MLQGASMSLRLGEIIVICFVLLVVFSAARMGQLGNALGKFVYSFKKSSKGDAFVEGKTLRRVPPDRVSDAEFTEPRKKS